MRQGAGVMGLKTAEADAIDSQNSIPQELVLARQVLEAVPSIIYVFDVADGKNIYQNRRVGELLGTAATDSESDGVSEWHRYIHPEDFARWPAQLERLKAIRAGETLSWEFRMRAKGGEWRWFTTQD